MKRFTLFYFIFLLIGLSGCSKYAMISMNYPVPPEANLPDKIKTIAIVNRSLTNKEDKAGKIIESVLSGELEVSDRKASEQSIAGVYERISTKDNFKCVVPEKYRLYGSGTREIPDLLEWDTVKDLCKSSGADALLVLEMFDSNSDMLSIPKILAPRPVDDERTFNVKMFWRLYDPESRKIIDQYECSRQVTFESPGRNVAIPPKALHGAAYSAGQEYIERFLPGYFIVDRPIYKKGKGSSNKAFAIAYRNVETDNWETAADRWEEILNSDNMENKGRACLNMAVYFEQTGNIESAIEMARRAYVDYGIKKGRDYEIALKRL